MNILLLGSGGREHALAWKMKQSPKCGKLFIAPGNAGTAQIGKNVEINPNDFELLRAFCLQNNIKMVVVGPEEPLVRGVYDFFQNEESLRKIKVIGPSQIGAQLEGSKAFAKRFMEEKNIPTAAYREVKTVEEGVEFMKKLKPPYVLKADGLAAGKGVLILDSLKEAKQELKEMLDGKFGDSSRTVVIEQFLKGIEFSVFVLTDGKSYKILPEAKDYKRIGEGDTGLNTGGMGAVSPVPFVSKAMMRKVEKRIIQPTVDLLNERKIDYKGFIFFGLISVKNNPFVIEYNCRMGDPETEVVIPRLKTDLVKAFDALSNGDLDKVKIIKHKNAAAAVMMVAGGYPEEYKKGDAITLPQAVNEDSLIFHAGTKSAENQLVTNGGRVIAITSFADNIKDAIAKSNSIAAEIDFANKYYRKDIGFEF